MGGRERERRMDTSEALGLVDLQHKTEAQRLVVVDLDLGLVDFKSIMRSSFD
ncbi:tRNA uridine-5-carboxymethylaminomethy [Sesbania bispinosa]|nr:tRNA uridine-5-carboxymethylaminomethy [Sesbania bispinosa]